MAEKASFASLDDIHNYEENLLRFYNHIRFFHLGDNFYELSYIMALLKSYFFIISLVILSHAKAEVCQSFKELPSFLSNKGITYVSNEAQLQSALSQTAINQVIVLSPGEYLLTKSLVIIKNNISLVGGGKNCHEVKLIGQGMDNVEGGNLVPYGIWTNAKNFSIENVTLRDIYKHGIVFNPGAENPHVSSVAMFDIGEQFIKSNPVKFGDGVDAGIVENSLFKYTNWPSNLDRGAGVGYTNGIDVHAGHNWIIRNNRFENFHTPDHAHHLWNPAILIWNGAKNSIVENNIFIDVDRAIAFGLIKRGYDHLDGVISNNQIIYTKGLYSKNRKSQSDSSIIVWDSPGTQVYQNLIKTNGNLNKSIEVRFSSEGVIVRNNTVDSPISGRANELFLNIDNVLLDSSKLLQ